MNQAFLNWVSTYELDLQCNYLKSWSLEAQQWGMTSQTWPTIFSDSMRKAKYWQNSVRYILFKNGKISHWNKRYLLLCKIVSNTVNVCMQIPYIFSSAQNKLVIIQSWKFIRHVDVSVTYQVIIQIDNCWKKSMFSQEFSRYQNKNYKRCTDYLGICQLYYRTQSTKTFAYKIYLIKDAEISSIFKVFDHLQCMYWYDWCNPGALD